MLQNANIDQVVLKNILVLLAVATQLGKQANAMHLSN